MKKISRQPRIVLASASPKRKELLEMIGLPFRVDPSDCSEIRHKRESLVAFAKRISRDKARCVAARHPDALIIAADTFGAIGKRFFGKARNVVEARTILESLSGRVHIAITGTTILDTMNGREKTFVTKTRVTFRKISPDELEWFLDSGEWRGKAACYTIVGKAVMFIDTIDGDIGTVLGLPLCELSKHLRLMGYKIPDFAT